MYNEPTRPAEPVPSQVTGNGLPMAGFWSRLTAEERGELQRVGTHVWFDVDELILRQGDHDRHLVVILTGSAKVVTRPANGREKLLALRGPGSLIGELAALTAMARSADVRALERVSALIISHAEFEGAARRNRGLDNQLTRVLAERLQLANQLVTEASVPAALPRLTALLASLGEQLAGTNPVVLRVSQAELASLAATSEASVARAIRTLRGMSLIRTGRSKITLVDPPALRRFADS